MERIILNLGAGNVRIAGSISVDIQPIADIQADLSKIPLEFEDNSIDGIYAFHIWEHFQDWKVFIDECVRILKPNGFLHLKVPHVTCVPSMGILFHYRGMSYNGFRWTLTIPTEAYSKPPFKESFCKINWKGRLTDLSLQHTAPMWVRKMFIPIERFMNCLINLYPELFENVWCYWVGGAEEVEWKGTKI
jgi:SAM-dependent methyltransferase